MGWRNGCPYRRHCTSFSSTDRQNHQQHRNTQKRSLCWTAAVLILVTGSKPTQRSKYFHSIYAALDCMSSGEYLKHTRRCVWTPCRFFASSCRDSSVHGMWVSHIWFYNKRIQWRSSQGEGLLRWGLGVSFQPSSPGICCLSQPGHRCVHQAGSPSYPEISFSLQFLLCWYGWLNYWPHDWTQSILPTLHPWTPLVNASPIPTFYFSGAQSHLDAIQRCPRTTSSTEQRHPHPSSSATAGL